MIVFFKIEDPIPALAGHFGHDAELLKIKEQAINGGLTEPETASKEGPRGDRAGV